MCRDNEQRTQNNEIDYDDHPSKIHPENQGVWLTKVMVFWITPLINLASERELLESDVWDAPVSQSASHDGKMVCEAWRQEQNQSVNENREPDFLMALYRRYGSDMLMAGLYQFAFVCTQLGQPFLVGELVHYISTGDGGLRRGLGLAFGLGALSFVSSFALALALYSLRRLGVSIRSGIMMAVYEHALKLTTTSRMQNTVEQIANLMSVDSEKIFVAVQFIHFLWHGPLTVFAIMLILIDEVGFAPALAGLGWILILIPLHNLIAKRIGIIRKAMAQFTDERMKVMDELLQAIRVIKLYAWEVPIEQRVQSKRFEEMKLLLKYLLTSSCLREVSYSAQPVAALVIFLTRVYGVGETITAVQVFRVLAFLNISRYPMNTLANALKSVNDGRVSIQRLTRFFQLSVWDNQVNKREQGGVPSIEVENAVFSRTNIHSDSGSSSINSNNISRTMESTIVLMNSRHSDNDDVITNHQRGDDTASGNVSVEAEAETKTATTTATVTGNDVNDTAILSFPRQLHLSFRTTHSNELIAVIGPVGSGKSSFMSALLSEIPRLAGTMAVTGDISYCAQTPWIQNMTLKDNIFFGVDSSTKDREMQAQYERAIHASALRHDLKFLPRGDLTLIGERGINLSGGQKARISIARALFSSHRSQIVLMDDPFSALDVPTGNRIFEHGVMRILQNKLRIIVLNSHMHLVRRFDRVIILDNGHRVADGAPAKLWATHYDLMAKITGMHSDAMSSRQWYGFKPITAVERMAPLVNGAITLSEETKDIVDYRPRRLTESPPPPALLSTESTTTNDVLTDKQMAATRRTKIGFGVYSQYFAASVLNPNQQFTDRPVLTKQGSHVNFKSRISRSMGCIIVIAVIILFGIVQTSRISIDYYLSRWAVAKGAPYSSWGTVYFVSLGCLGFLLLVRALCINYITVRSSTNLHSAVLHSVLSASVPAFYDMHTVGEILNRFHTDMRVVDTLVPETLVQVIISNVHVISILALCIWASYYFAIILLPLMLGVFHMYRHYANISQALKGLEMQSRMPVYASLSETLTGLETIRAYGDTERFLTTHRSLMDVNQKFFFHLWMSICWVTVRLELTTSFILLAFSLLSVFRRNYISATSLGLALTCVMRLTALFQRCVQITIDLTVYMASTERVVEYLAIPQEQSTLEKHDTISTSEEATLAGESSASSTDKSTNTTPDGVVIGGDVSDGDVELSATESRTGKHDQSHQTAYELVPTIISDTTENFPTPNEPQPLHQHPQPSDELFDEHWPRTGNISFEDVWMQYRDNPPVLKGLSFSVRHGERIGICGRTGAGKSSLILALFRMAELTRGRILIDGVDIAGVPLQTLRSNLAIIPQEPVLFTGTIRYQMDPFNQYTDSAIWEALSQVHMRDVVRAMSGGILEEVKENGANLSQGQKQLLCVARALLRQTKVLIFDEGTSAVDSYTDDLIQKVLRNVVNTRHTTVLVIEHRLHTIVDFDRILVLSYGKILEYDTPETLLADPESVFSTMFREASG